MIMAYRNKKTGTIYYLINSAMNTTNKNDGEKMIIYINKYKNYFVREYTEFLEEFERAAEEDLW